MKTLKIEGRDDIPIIDADTSKLKKLVKKVVSIEDLEERVFKVPDGIYHVGCKQTGVINKNIKAFVMNFWEYEKGGGCMAHSHDDDQVAYITSGKFLWNIDGEDNVVEKGTLISLPVGTVHGYKAIEKSTMLLMAPKFVLRQTIYPNVSYPEILQRTNINYDTL